MRIWLHHCLGNEEGWNAWSLDYLGFATWAPTRDEVLRRVPIKFVEYQEWLRQHQHVVQPTTQLLTNEYLAEQIIIVEEVSGDEIVFTHDLGNASRSEIMLCSRLLDYSRNDLLDTVAGLPDSVLDWDPPYRQFASWARWRTIRQILQHIAVTEIAYYLPAIGYTGITAFDYGTDWLQQLAVTRAETKQFLHQLADAEDRARVTIGEEIWSVRKVLRRLVRHELLHLKSIKRILHDFNYNPQFQ